MFKIFSLFLVSIVMTLILLFAGQVDCELLLKKPYTTGVSCGQCYQFTIYPSVARNKVNFSKYIFFYNIINIILVSHLRFLFGRKFPKWKLLTFICVSLPE